MRQNNQIHNLSIFCRHNTLSKYNHNIVHKKYIKTYYNKRPALTYNLYIFTRR